MRGQLKGEDGDGPRERRRAGAWPMIHRIYKTELTVVRKRVLEATAQEVQNPRQYRRQLDFNVGPGGLVAQLPTSANIELTNDCQLACTMCPRTADPHPPQYLSVTNFDLILDRLREAGIDRVVLQYLGEPTLHPEFLNCVTTAKKKIGLVGFVTNGLRLTGELAARVLDLPVDRVSISLDGSDPDGYHRVRKGSDLELVERNLREFVAARDRRGGELPLVAVRTLLIPGAVPTTATLERWAGLADLLEIRCCMPTGSPRTETDPDVFPCPLAFRNLTVRSDGRAQVCCTDFAGELALGNLLEHSVEELWNGAAAWRLRKALLDAACLPGVCRHCLLRLRQFHREFSALLKQTGLEPGQTASTLLSEL